jgi:hypothetical protein
MVPGITHWEPTFARFRPPLCLVSPRSGVVILGFLGILKPVTVFFCLGKTFLVTPTRVSLRFTFFQTL